MRIAGYRASDASLYTPARPPPHALRAHARTHALRHEVHRIDPARDAPPHPTQHLAPLLLLARVRIITLVLARLVFVIRRLMILGRLLDLDLLHRHALRLQRGLELAEAMA